MGFRDLGSRWTESDSMQEQIWSATITEKNMSLYLSDQWKKERGILGFLWKYLKNAFKLAYLWERLFFFLISARQGVTITEICESGCKFWRKHLSTCRQVKLELIVWCKPCDITPANFLNLKTSKHLEERKKESNVMRHVFSTLSEETGGGTSAAQSTHAGLGCHWAELETFSLYLTIFLICVVQSFRLDMYLFLPFLAGFRDPSSEKLTGPVQFPVSSPLRRLNCCALVRKWVSLFGIYCSLLCKCKKKTHPSKPMCSHTNGKCHSHPHIQENSQGMKLSNCFLFTAYLKV